MFFYSMQIFGAFTFMCNKKYLSEFNQLNNVDIFSGDRAEKVAVLGASPLSDFTFAFSWVAVSVEFVVVAMAINCNLRQILVIIKPSCALAVMKARVGSLSLKLIKPRNSPATAPAQLLSLLVPRLSNQQSLLYSNNYCSTRNENIPRSCDSARPQHSSSSVAEFLERQQSVNS